MLKLIMKPVQARDDNAADVQAKDQSQETLVEFFGLILGYLSINLTQEEPVAVITLFIISIFAHLYFNFRAVKSVCQSTLNLSRARIIIGEYSKTGKIISIIEANRLEPVIFSVKMNKKIIIGAKWNSTDDVIKFSPTVGLRHVLID
jgi:hypothetical protein